MKNELKKAKKPWPTKQAMEQIYAKNLWGDNGTSFYSGEGSHRPEILNPYIDTLIPFLKSFKEPLVVCDFGCGDFNVGKKLIQYTKKYIAIDIVPELIKHNKRTYKKENLEFHCLDIALDKLPDGDCVVLRQVLQHLSNSEVQRIVNKLASYKYVILTEHLPKGNFKPNIDIISGQSIRLKKHSGLNLLIEPFNLKTKETKPLLEIFLEDSNSCVTTTLYKIF